VVLNQALFGTGQVLGNERARRHFGSLNGFGLGVSSHAIRGSEGIARICLKVSWEARRLGEAGLRHTRQVVKGQVLHQEHGQEEIPKENTKGEYHERLSTEQRLALAATAGIAIRIVVRCVLFKGMTPPRILRSSARAQQQPGHDHTIAVLHTVQVSTVVSTARGSTARGTLFTLAEETTRNSGPRTMRTPRLPPKDNALVTA
jgi:hypothetical protein